jgi:hypothetical protein
MLIIRNSQLTAFGEERRTAFVRSMCGHLRTYFPSMASLDDGALFAGIDYAARRAAVHGLSRRRDVCSYLNIAACHGWQFDTDPQCEWMMKYLTDRDVSCPSARLDLLLGKCLQRDEISTHNRQLQQLWDGDTAQTQHVSVCELLRPNLRPGSGDSTKGYINEHA